MLGVRISPGGPTTTIIKIHQYLFSWDYVAYHFVEFNMIDITLMFKSYFCGSWPMVKILLDGQPVTTCRFSQEFEQITTTFDDGPGHHVLQLIRVGKDRDNIILGTDGKILQDQALELTELQLNRIPIPAHILDDHAVFEYKGHKQTNSRYFGPNGIWTFKFQSPMINWALDKKIDRDSQYNRDHGHPWSHHLGPGNVDKISAEIVQAQCILATLNLP